MKEKVIMEAVGNRPLTVEERALYGRIWRAYSDVDKFLAAAKICHIEETVDKMSAIDFIRTCATVAEFDYRYNTTTIK
jgi:hypothetical protein